MKGPEQFDNGYRDSLGRQDTADFDELYRKKYRSIDDDRARESFVRSFEANTEAEHRLFRNVVNAFSTAEAGFTTTIVNPLYEFDVPDPEVLLAKFQANSVHLCFVSCKVGGEEYESWKDDINEAHAVATDEEVLTNIKQSILCEGLDIGTVQYVTLTRAKDIPDVDVEIIQAGSDPDYYALWKLLREEEYNETTGEMEAAKTIHYEAGSMAVPEFQNVCSDGIDLLGADNDDIRFSLTSHPVFALGEVCLHLYLNRDADADNAKEFFRSEFAQAYRENTHFGDNRAAIDPIADQKIEDLLDFGLNHGILKDDDDVVEERDYKIMWGSENAADIKGMVRRKYTDDKVPEETGKMAFSRAKEQFTEGEHSLDDFDFKDS